MQKEKSKIITFSGRYQPFGPHHYRAYKYLCEKFGVDYVWITTSNKIEYPDSPFNFIEKKQIITTMFSIPETVVVQIKNPYDPQNLKSEQDQKKTVFITALSKKDANRLSYSNYFQMYSDDIELLPMNEAGYVYIIPEFKIYHKHLTFDKRQISGTFLRNEFAFERFKKKLFNDIYGRFDEEVYKLITNRLSFMKLMKEEHLNG